MFKKIVVGIDGSAPSNTALEIACDLAGKYGAEVHLVHTPQPQTVAFALGAVPGYHAAITMPAEVDVAKAANKLLDEATKLAANAGQKIAGTHIETGDPADQVVRYASDRGCDLIITGRRGLGAVGALLQGSTTQRINHLAECACLSVV